MQIKCEAQRCGRSGEGLRVGDRCVPSLPPRGPRGHQQWGSIRPSILVGCGCPQLRLPEDSVEPAARGWGSTSTFRKTFAMHQEEPTREHDPFKSSSNLKRVSA